MGTVGRSAVIPDDIPPAINTKHLACISLDESKCNPFYLAYSIHSNPYIAYQMKSRNRGAIMEGLNLGIIKQLKLKSAPISLQKDFEIIYKKINDFKVKIENLNTIELYKSILQKAFSGQLNFDIATELDALLQEIKLKEPINDVVSIVTNEQYIENLVQRLNTQDFETQELYDKAKKVAFQLLKEEEVITQELDKSSNSIKLKLK